MESNQHINRMSRLLSNDFQVRFPRIRADVLQPLATLGTTSTKVLQWHPGLTLLPNPQQLFTVAVDLIDEGQVIVAPLPDDFVDPNNPHATNILMGAPHSKAISSD